VFNSLKNKNQILNNFIPFIAIVLLAFFLRTIYLDTVPRGLQADEASFLINSVAMLETGKDEDNRFLPIYLHSLIDSKPALYSYLQIPFFALYGVSTGISRLPSALIGVGSIVLFYFLIRETTKNHRLALLGMLLLTISPWHIVNSRATQEVILSLFFILANFIFLSQIIKSKIISWQKLVLFILTAGLAMYSYHAAKIVLTGFYILMSGYVFFTKHDVSQKKRTWFLTLGVVFMFFLTMGAATTRFSAIGILTDDLPKALIFDYTIKSTDITPLVLIRAFYNKPLFYFLHFFENYLAHFDLNFLFTLGGATARFLVPQHGLFYIVELLLLPIGLFQLLKRNKYKKLITPLIILILLSPIPAAMTTEEIPSSIRSFTMIIPIIFLIAIGLDWVMGQLEKLKPLLKYTALTSLFLVYLWSVAFFSQQFLVMMPIQNVDTRSRQYEITTGLLSNISSEYNYIMATNDLRELYIYLWLEDLITIEEIQQQPLARYNQSYSIGKYHFNQGQCEFENFPKPTLYISPNSCREKRPKNISVIEQTYFDDGITPAFTLFTNQMSLK
jgi:4-amino-4-deoxy-L-arabinose transferase-like glycosyltransferase